MGKSYSEDLRGRVMRDYEKSGNKSETEERFCIQDDTIRRWIKLKKDTGSLKPKKPPGIVIPTNNVSIRLSREAGKIKLQ